MSTAAAAGPSWDSDWKMLNSGITTNSLVRGTKDTSGVIPTGLSHCNKHVSYGNLVIFQYMTQQCLTQHQLNSKYKFLIWINNIWDSTKSFSSSTRHAFFLTSATVNCSSFFYTGHIMHNFKTSMGSKIHIAEIHHSCPNVANSSPFSPPARLLPIISEYFNETST